MRLTIRAQIILACVAVMLLPAALGFYHLSGHYRSARARAVGDSREKAQAIASAVSALIVNLQNGALVLAEEARAVGADPPHLRPTMDRMVRAARTRAYVTFFRSDGHVAAAVPGETGDSGLNVADRLFFQTLRAGSEWTVIDLIQSRVRGVPVWGVAAAVRAGDRFLGAVALTVPAAEFDRLVSVRMPAASWSIVDTQGQLVYLNGVAEIPWDRRDRSTQELIRRALSGAEATSEDFVGSDGARRLGASVPILPSGWVVEVSRPVAEALAEARSLMWVESGKYGLALAIALLIAVIIGNRAGLSISRLTAAADRAARGQYETVAEPGGPAELVRLLSAFNAMTAELRRRQRWDEALTTIGRAATSLSPLDAILATGLEAIMSASGAALGVIRLVDPATKDLVVAAHKNLPQEYLDVAARVPWGAKPAGYVASTGEPWLIGRLQEQREVSRLSVLAEGIQSLACLPLKAHDRVVGTIALGQREVECFGPADLPVLLPAASLLAGAILAQQLHAAANKEAEERTLLFREMDHRVRNNLAALISLLRLGAEEAEEKAGGILREMADRVARLADVHNLSTSRGMQSIEVRELAEMIAKNVFAAVSGGGEIRWRVTGTPFRVPASRGATLALILNELLTNCVKHAFVGRAMGTVAVRVGYDGHEAEVEVQDDGVGLDLTRRPSSLGLTIVETLVTHNLQGSLQFMNQGGTRVSIRFPHQQEVVTGGAA